MKRYKAATVWSYVRRKQMFRVEIQNPTGVYWRDLRLVKAAIRQQLGQQRLSSVTRILPGSPTALWPNIGGSQVMTGRLQDSSGDGKGPSVNFMAEATALSVEIGVEGFGEKTSLPPYARPIFLEFYEGKLTLRVWADINQEDPTHVIDLSGALETKREI